jgi:hypothetical protein
MNLAPQRHRHCGFTVPEFLVAAGVGGLIITAAMVSLVFCCRSFVAMGNYMELNKASLTCLDRITRDIREVRYLQTFATNQLVFLDYSSNQLAYVWNPSSRQLTRSLAGTTNILLYNCDYLTFHISQRTPSNGVFGFFPATNNPAICKMVDVSWRCSRTILGFKVNTESVQTAKIVMRN